MKNIIRITQSTILILSMVFCCEAQVRLGSFCGAYDSGMLGGEVAVSADGFTIAVGSLGFEEDKGMVQIYRFNGQSFIKLGQDLIGGDSEGLFGASLDLSDDGKYLAVCAPYDFVERGKVTIYEYDDVVDEWTQLGQEILGTPTRIGFNASIHNDGKQLLIATHGNAYDMYRLHNDMWERTGPRLSDGLRSRVKISGDESAFVFGANGTDGKDGAVVYQWDGEEWSQKGQRVLVDFLPGSGSGDVCINYDGGIMAFSDLFSGINGLYTGTTYVYQFVNGAWEPLGNPIYGLNVGDRSGTNLDMNDNGDRIAIHMSGNGTSSGRIRIYDLVDGDWILETSVNNVGDFGRGFDLNDTGNIIAVGSPYQDCNGVNNSGRLWLYELTEPIGWETVSGAIFYDNNNNKIRDADEFGIPNIKVRLSGTSSISLTDFQGNFEVQVKEGIYYNLSPKLGAGWEITTDSSSYSFEFSPSDIERYDFGVYREGSSFSSSVVVTSEPTECNRETDFHLRILNDGNIPLDGELVFTLDNLTEYINASHTLIEDEASLIYQIDSLLSFQSLDIIIKLRMPAEETVDNHLGFDAKVYSQQELLDSTHYEVPVRCSFDTSDKLVNPIGVEEEAYTVVDEALFYTIRFQNTGSAIVSNVKILDTLDRALDTETFEVVNTSHTLRTKLDGCALEFIFENINLIDSITNEPESHGFVQYRILPFSNVEELVEIENTAHIIFDLNPATITNTTVNTLVDSICFDQYISEQITICEGEDYFGYIESGLYDIIIPIAASCDSIVSIDLIVLPASDPDCAVSTTNNDQLDDIDISPNPANEMLYVNGGITDLMFEVIDINGKVVISTDATEIDVENLQSGIYLLRSFNAQSSLLKKFIKL